MPAVTLATNPLISQQGRRAQRLAPTVVGAMGAATVILTTALTPLYQVGYLRVTVALSVATTFRIHVTPTGAGVQILNAQQGNNLVAESLYTWEVPSGEGCTYNFSALAAATVRYFSIEELEASQ